MFKENTQAAPPPILAPGMLANGEAYGEAYGQTLARQETASVLFVDQSGQLGGAEFSLMPLAVTWGARREVLLLSDGPFRTRLESLGVPVSLACEASVSDIRKDTLRLSWLGAHLAQNAGQRAEPLQAQRVLANAGHARLACEAHRHAERFEPRAKGAVRE